MSIEGQLHARLHQRRMMPGAPEFAFARLASVIVACNGPPQAVHCFGDIAGVISSDQNVYVIAGDHVAQHVDRVLPRHLEETQQVVPPVLLEFQEEFPTMTAVSDMITL